MALSIPTLKLNQDLLSLLEQTAPQQERAIGLYRRLLEISHVAAAMNAAKDVEQIQECLAGLFESWMPEDSARLCIVDDKQYRRSRLSGPDISVEEGTFPIGSGAAGTVLLSGSPLWIPDTGIGNPPSGGNGAGMSEYAQSLLVLPFAAMGRVVGALEIVSNQPNRIDDIDYHLAFLVAAHLSSSLENVITRQELISANARLRDRDERLRQLNQQLQQLAHTDDLTGLFNKRRLMEQLEAEIARTRRYGEIMSCLMIDIDDFKQVNDTYGHQAGDEALKQVGTIIRRSLRVTDFVARYGGEEFTALLPRTDGLGAHRAAENLCQRVRDHLIQLPGIGIRLTISVGIASCTKFDKIDSKQVFLRADGALYQAKRAGKDRVCLAGETGTVQ